MQSCKSEKKEWKSCPVFQFSDVWLRCRNKVLRCLGKWCNIPPFYDKKMQSSTNLLGAIFLKDECNSGLQASRVKCVGPVKVELVNLVSLLLLTHLKWVKRWVIVEHLLLASPLAPSLHRLLWLAHGRNVPVLESALWLARSSNFFPCDLVLSRERRV